MLRFNDCGLASDGLERDFVTWMRNMANQHHTMRALNACIIACDGLGCNRVPVSEADMERSSEVDLGARDRACGLDDPESTAFHFRHAVNALRIVLRGGKARLLIDFNKQDLLPVKSETRPCGSEPHEVLKKCWAG